MRNSAHRLPSFETTIRAAGNGTLERPQRALPDFVAYQATLGTMIMGLAEDILKREEMACLKGSVQLIFTSPPFPLQRKKKYGNLKGSAYKLWLASFGPALVELLRPDGSIVLELGNSWEPGSPTMSTLALEALLEFKSQNGLYLCQEFICHNPARLPGPAQWVTVKRVRVKDSFTRLWWLSPSQNPKADNRRVLTAYSEAMKSLISRGNYNSGKRPSEHDIGSKSFLKDHGGAIPPSVLSISNTSSNDRYRKYCKDNELELHPARMPPDLAKFFINLLTEPGDIVLDPFGGSNVTGAAAEELGRRWITIEPTRAYVAGSVGRFSSLVWNAGIEGRRSRLERSG